MTREEEIIEAGIEYNMQNSPCCIGGDNFYEQAKEFNRNKSFEAGAKWADERTQSPWISVEDDLPCNHDDLIYFGETILVLTRFEDGELYVTHMRKSKVTNNWYWVAVKHVTHWMPIPKLND